MQTVGWGVVYPGLAPQALHGDHFWMPIGGQDCVPIDNGTGAEVFAPYEESHAAEVDFSKSKQEHKEESFTQPPEGQRQARQHRRMSAGGTARSATC